MKHHFLIFIFHVRKPFQSFSSYMILIFKLHVSISCIYTIYGISASCLLNKSGLSPESLGRYYYYYRTRRNIVIVTTHNNTCVRIFIAEVQTANARRIILLWRQRAFDCFLLDFLQSNERASRINYPSSRTHAVARHTIYDRTLYNNIIGTYHIITLRINQRETYGSKI